MTASPTVETSDTTRQAVNPYLPSWEYVPDGEPHVFGDRLYIFGSHDRFRGQKYCENDYVGWSAPFDDLSNWESHGVIYRKDQDPDNTHGEMALWAPDVAQGADGRYYLYYGTEFHPRLSIAVADEPAGPYEFLGKLTYKNGAQLGEKPGDAFPFDPAVFVDEDGRVYVYFGFGPNQSFLTERIDRLNLEYNGAYVVELEPDMVTIKAGPRVIVPKAGRGEGSGFEGHEFFEASSLRRIDDTYYFVYSSINGHELCYATSDRPDDGFTYQGILVSNGDIGYNGRLPEDRLNYTANNHGGLVEVNGQWYIFYHRHTDRTQYSRQGLAEPIERDADGRFAQVEMTSSGLNGKPLRGEGTYETGIACVLQGPEGASPEPHMVETRVGPDPYFTQTGDDREGSGDQYIANLKNGAVAGFKYFDLQQTRKITVDVRGDGRGVLNLSTELDGSPTVSIPVDPDNRGAQEAALPSGLGERTALFFRYQGEGTVDFHSFTLS
jgi:arabinoxylan arabinofuranohydrolase